jgi:hypothetical protein
MTLASIIEPAPGEMLSFEAAGRWGAWCFALDPADATDRLHRAAHAGALRVWRGGGSAPAPVSLAEVARWQGHAPPGRVFDVDAARMVVLPGPLRLRWSEAFAALAAEFHARAAPLSREDATALTQAGDDWLHPADALARIQPVLAPLVPSSKVQRCLGVVAIALNLVPVAERQGDGSVRPIVLEPGQAWDLPGIGRFLHQEWRVLADPQASRVRAAPWLMESDGPVPVPRQLWRAAHAPDRDRLVPAPAWSPIALQVPRLLAALRTLASDGTRCQARGITPPEIVEPLLAARRWTPAQQAIADAGATARRMAIGAAIREGRLPVALRLPQGVTAGVPPEDVPVPTALLPCLTLAEGIETGGFDWRAAVAIADAESADAETRTAVAFMAPARRGRDDAMQWESVGLALRPAELAAVLEEAPDNMPPPAPARRPRLSDAAFRAAAEAYAQAHKKAYGSAPKRDDVVAHLVDKGAKTRDARAIYQALPIGLRRPASRPRKAARENPDR